MSTDTPQDQIENRPVARPPTQFQPGRSGNPAGRPKGLSLTARLRHALDQAEKDKDGKPTGRVAADVLVDELVKLARNGDGKAIKYVFDRVDGKAPETVLTFDGASFTTDQQRFLESPDAVALACQVDDLLARRDPDPGVLRDEGEPGKVGLGPAPVAPEP